MNRYVEKHRFNFSRLSISEKLMIRVLVVSFYFVYFFSLQFLVVTNKYGKFSTNDEFFFLGALTGLFSGSPSYRTYFLSPILTYPLQVLFTHSPNIPWYGIAHIVTIFLIGLLFVMYILNLYERLLISKIQLYLSFFIFWIFFVYLSFEYQITHLSIMASGLGLLVFFMSNNKYLSFYAIFILLLGLMWRFEGAILGFFIAALFVLQIGYLNKAMFDIKEIVSKLVKVLLIIFLVSSVNFFSYSKFSPVVSLAEKEFSQYNSERGKFHGWVPYYVDQQVEKKIAETVGWSSNDLQLIRFFFTADNKVFNYENLKSFNDKVSSDNSYHNDTGNILALYNNFKPYILLLLYINLLLLVFYATFPSLFIVILNLTIPVLAGLATLLIGSIPERVFFPTIFLVAIFSTLSFFVLNKESKVIRFLKQQKYLPLLIIQIITIVILFSQIFSNTKLILNSQKNTMLSNQFYQNAICSGALDGLLFHEFRKPVVAFSSFYTSIQMCTLPLDNYQENRKFWSNVILIGWSVNSTGYMQQIKSLGVSPDLVSSIAEGRAYLAVGEQIQTEIISEFLRQHYDLEIAWSAVPDLQAGHLQVWSVASSKPIEKSLN